MVQQGHFCIDDISWDEFAWRQPQKKKAPQWGFWI
jgi:hypothetical protein